MPYCPKCQQEFVEGVTICSDCGGPLVDNKESAGESVKLISIELSLAERLTSFLIYSGIPATTLPDEEDETLLQVFVPEPQTDEGKKLVQVFLANEPTEEENIPLDAKPARIYKKNSERYQDLHSSAFAFLTVGAFVLLVMLLSLAGILKLPFYGSSRILIHTVMIAVGIIFMIIGVISRKNAEIVKGTIKEEENRTAEILDWFLSTYAPAQIDESINASEEITTDEIRSLKRMDIIRDYLVRQYQITDDAYLDLLCEELYQKLYEA